VLSVTGEVIHCQQQQQQQQPIQTAANGISDGSVCALSLSVNLALLFM
jgi:hypothetical protein